MPQQQHAIALHPTSPADRTFLIGLLVDPDVRRFLGGPVSMYALPGTVARYMHTARHHGSWIVTVAGRPAGLITLTPHHDRPEVELSYQFMPRVWGQGIASTACQIVLDPASPQAPVIAETQVANRASCALLTRLGFREEDRLTRFGAEQVIYRLAR